MIIIIDYGVSNLSCVHSAVKRLGHDVQISSDPSNLTNADAIILPGVGAFSDAMTKLNQSGLADALNDAVIVQSKPFLGICLGAQLVCQQSEEFGICQGLAWFDAKVVQIPKGPDKLRVPHTGWDDIEHIKGSILLQGISTNDLFYFTHSYGILPDDDQYVVAYCDYSIRFAAILQRDHIFATQFHPEKSQQKGLELLNNFCQYATECYAAE